MRTFLMVAMMMTAVAGFYRNLFKNGPSGTPDISVAPDPDKPNEHPKELGRVTWMRGYDNAVRRARTENKPILILFQEVPGCATCVGYGQQVLSHPLLVDAIENLFVPLAVYNNIGADDRKTLDAFKEPAWNNPVVRITTADRKELSERVDGDYTMRGIIRAMKTALQSTKHEVPEYLQILSDEMEAMYRTTERATFAMSCFWEGEAALGKVRGIVSTTPGFLNGSEVVEVEYVPSIISYDELVKKAEAQQCSLIRNANDSGNKHLRPDSEPKYYLSKTLLRFVPMTPLQASRVNAAIGDGNDPTTYFSPRQMELFRLIKAHPTTQWKNFIGTPDIAIAWNEVQTLVQSITKM